LPPPFDCAPSTSTPRDDRSRRPRLERAGANVHQLSPGVPRTSLS
jgi:hypothetical protein